MKNRYAIIFPALLFSFLFLYPGCSKQSRFKYVVYEGYVYSSINQKPAENISIVLKACGKRFGEIPEKCGGSQFEVGSTVTDADGHFYIKARASKNGWYFAYWRANNNAGDPVNHGNGTSAAGLAEKEYSVISVPR